MVEVSKESNEGVSVISDDTDVFVLLLHFYAQENLSGQEVMESPVGDREVTDIGSTAEDISDILPDLLAAHALSGCDTVACYHGIGKGTHLSSVGNPESDIATIIKESTKFVSTCFNKPDCASMSEARQKVWVARVAKSNSAAPKLCSLPPTSESFHENVKRAHLQACIWKHALDAEPPSMDPDQFGWIKNEDNKCYLPVMVPSGTHVSSCRHT
ncbi:hypothetical protein KUTeg_004633 [Tegillarca granosa]|uniref:Uncharacterized protein n=1 Tax=Tegillarca granosa TaxID=220873 RepID=A0ABQ9FKH7_TEGGR|nr:hypothetical protein KUTeg_004633 [Tegillarca granosa]